MSKKIDKKNLLLIIDKMSQWDIHAASSLSLPLNETLFDFSHCVFIVSISFAFRIVAINLSFNDLIQFQFVVVGLSR